MNAAVRLRVFLFASAGFLLLYCMAARNLAPWGQYRGPYGDVVSRLVVYQRHATDAVNAITYDYRGFDTLGEEFILFSAADAYLRCFFPCWSSLTKRPEH